VKSHGSTVEQQSELADLKNVGAAGLVGGGMLLGAVVVVPAIALGAAFGVKKLFDVVWKDNKNS